MKILITGTSGGIGRAIAEEFLSHGHSVVGIDIAPTSIHNAAYSHIVQDIMGNLPELDGVEILINNAGVQNTGRDIDVNLKGAIRVTEKYGFTPSIKSILFIASASGQTGAEFPEYAASKGGMIAYMKNVASRVAPLNATANSLSPGGVITNLNSHILESKDLWNRVLDETLLHKWATPQEIAQWAYFVTVINRSMTAQDLLIDNGEAAKFNFVW